MKTIKKENTFMKNTRIFIALIAVIALMLCFVSCKNNDVPPVTNTPPASNTEPELVIDAETLAKYTIVRRDEATTEEKNAATTLATDIEAAFGVNLTVVSDFETATEYEILVGETNRDESAASYDGLKYNDYRISAKGSKIVIVAGCEESLVQAVEYFSSLFEGEKLEVKSYEHNATYALDGMTIGGVKASEYNIVYASEKQLASAKIIQKAIGERTGERLSVVDQKTDKTEYEIVVGKTSRKTYDKISYYNYEIFNDGKSIYINPYDEYALYAAAEKFSDTVGNMGPAVTVNDFDYNYQIPTHEELIEDIDKLYMRWASEWTPDPRLLDFDLKIDAFLNVSDRLLVSAHRAEATYYPENSLGAIISFYKMGGFSVELDIRPTKDGVLVLMHDETLKRTTNWSEVNGKVVNGIQLPTSNKLSDWTYAQVQQLYLKEEHGGDKAIVTPFRVPSLVDALKVCKDRIFITPDKQDQWRYSNKDNLAGNPSYYLFDAMKKADNYTSILLSTGINKTGAVAVQKQIYEYSGEIAYVIPRDGNASASTYKYLKENAIENSFGIQVGGTFEGTTSTHTGSTFQEWKDMITIWGWTIEEPETNDNIKVWQEMYDLGYRMIMTNEYLEMLKFAASKYSFD